MIGKIEFELVVFEQAVKFDANLELLLLVSIAWVLNAPPQVTSDKQLI